MKYRFIFILIIPLFGILKAQSPCVSPISPTDFNKKIAEVRQIKENEKTPIALQGILDNHCFTSGQITEMLKLITNNEVAKADIAILAYERVLDKWSYYEIFDNFRSLSSAIRVYDQTLGNKSNVAPSSGLTNDKTSTTAQTSSNIQPNNTTNPASSCLIPDAEFEQIRILLTRNTFESARLNIAKQMIADKKCLAATQLGVLSRLFTSESSIINFLVYSYQFLPDKTGFETVLTQHSETVRKGVAKELK